MAQHPLLCSHLAATMRPFLDQKGGLVLGFVIGFFVVTAVLRLVGWVKSHTWHEIRWQECPICHGNGKSPGNKVFRCLTCMGYGGWAVSTRKYLSQSHSDRPL